MTAREPEHRPTAGEVASLLSALSAPGSDEREAVSVQRVAPAAAMAPAAVVARGCGCAPAAVSAHDGPPTEVGAVPTRAGASRRRRRTAWSVSVGRSGSARHRGHGRGHLVRHPCHGRAGHRGVQPRHRPGPPPPRTGRPLTRRPLPPPAGRPAARARRRGTGAPPRHRIPPPRARPPLLPGSSPARRRPPPRALPRLLRRRRTARTGPRRRWSRRRARRLPTGPATVHPPPASPGAGRRHRHRHRRRDQAPQPTPTAQPSPTGGPPGNGGKPDKHDKPEAQAQGQGPAGARPTGRSPTSPGGNGSG